MPTAALAPYRVLDLTTERAWMAGKMLADLGADVVCQRFAATALIAALDHRRRTGEGQHIDLSQYEAAVQTLGPQLLAYELKGEVATRDGNRSEWACPHGVYPTQPVRGHEGWVAIAVETDGQWAALRAAMGDPAWAARADYDTLLGRKAGEAVEITG